VESIGERASWAANDDCDGMVKFDNSGLPFDI
jgi:hypothetical protein